VLKSKITKFIYNIYNKKGKNLRIKETLKYLCYMVS